MVVKHCKRRISLGSGRKRDGELTLERQEHIEANTPAGRVLEEANELGHEWPGHLDRERQAGDGDHDASGGASKFLEANEVRLFVRSKK